MFQCTNSVFNITNENNSFSNSIPARWRNRNYLEDDIIDKLKRLLKLRSQNDFELHVEEITKRGNKTKIGNKEFKLSDIDISGKEILEDLRNANFYDLEDLV